MALSDDIKHAHAVATTAEASRQDLRWNVKPGDPDRETQLSGLLEDIRLAMVPIRRAMGLASAGRLPAASEEKARAASERLQYERRQLKKMQRT
jgi:hypothetical protein